MPKKNTAFLIFRDSSFYDITAELIYFMMVVEEKSAVFRIEIPKSTLIKTEF